MIENHAAEKWYQELLRVGNERDALKARVAELEEALSLAPCECDQLRGFDKCPRCLALNK